VILKIPPVLARIRVEACPNQEDPGPDCSFTASTGTLGHSKLSHGEAVSATAGCVSGDNDPDHVASPSPFGLCDGET